MERVEHSEISMSKSGGRLRAACDSCHQAKIKCSGTALCTACQASQLRCVYSPGKRLGRPKGSKNKKTLMLQTGNKHGKTHDVEDSTGAAQGPDSAQRQHRYQQQHLHNSDSPSLDELDFDYETDNAYGSFDHGTTSSGPYRPPSSPDLISLFDSMDVAYLDATHTNFNAVCAQMRVSFLSGFQSSYVGSESQIQFAQSCTAPRQPAPSHLMPHETPNHEIDHDYGTGTSSAFDDDTSCSAAHALTFPGGRSDPECRLLSCEPPRCSCLQQQVELVYQLCDLQFYQAGSLALDRILQGVQFAQGPWKTLMHCHTCQSQEGEREAYLLLATSIGILLSAIHSLITSFHHNDGVQGIAKAYDGSRVSDTTCSVLVGSYELMGEAKAEVLGVAVRDALEKISPPLLHLWERAGRPRRPSSSDSSGLERIRTPGRNNSSVKSFLSRPASTAAGSQESYHNDCPLSLNASATDVAFLLETLQFTMGVIKGGLSRVSATETSVGPLPLLRHDLGTLPLR
ncbi:hypothetical protein CDD83_6259 [Cordyceps sp. RAO-2017]|nr:hypothetical protein CDD83_6259 [Cordyceps sp. RAO-2017]